ncbi:MAG: hypothetical protein ACM3PT_01375 [Deltaproteobacteria bacterium]
MHSKIINRNLARGYSEFSQAPVPTKFTKTLRKNWIYQAYRWLVLNIKILRIVAFGHS